jgi:hypothetical protein
MHACRSVGIRQLAEHSGQQSTATWQTSSAGDCMRHRQAAGEACPSQGKIRLNSHGWKLGSPYAPLGWHSERGRFLASVRLVLDGTSLRPREGGRRRRSREKREKELNCKRARLEKASLHTLKGRFTSVIHWARAAISSLESS